MYGTPTDQSHIHTVVELNPKTPCRTSAILGKGENSGPALSQMSKNLVKANVDFVVVACNTAHAFQKDIEQGCGDVPFLSMIQVTADTVVGKIDKNGGSRKCGILATTGCITAGLYQNALTARNIEPYLPTQKSQDLMMDIIFRIKGGDKSDKLLKEFISIMRECKEENGCNQMILGCTELPLIFEQCMEIYDKITHDDVVDSTDTMVETVVKIAKRDLDLNDTLKRQQEYTQQVTFQKPDQI